MDVVVIRCQARRKMNPRWRTLNDGWSVGDIMRYDPVESAKLTQIFRFVCVVLSKWILDSIQCRTGRAVKRDDILRCALHCQSVCLNSDWSMLRSTQRSHVFDGGNWPVYIYRCKFVGYLGHRDKRQAGVWSFPWERKGTIFPVQNPRKPQLGYPEGWLESVVDFWLELIWRGNCIPDRPAGRGPLKIRMGNYLVVFAIVFNRNCVFWSETTPALIHGSFLIKIKDF